MTAAVVILTWNNKKYLDEFLPILIANTCNPCVDIIIADNASTDGTVDWLKTEYPNVKVLAFEENLGYAGGYKKALSMLSYDVFICMNSDIEVGKNWVEPLLQCLESDETIGACMPKIRSLYDRSKFEYAGAAGGLITKLGYPFCRGRMVNHTEEDKGQYDNQVPLFWASGACFAVKSKAYCQAGGFDERFFAHMEEIDLCWRMQSLGWKLVCESSSVVYHIGGGSLPVSNPKKTFFNFRNSLYMLYKNLHEKDFYMVFMMRVMVDCGIALLFLIKGEMSSVKAVIDAYVSFVKTYNGMRIKSMPRTQLKNMSGVYRWIPKYR